MRKLCTLLILILLAISVNAQKKGNQLANVEYDSINYLNDSSRVILKKKRLNTRVGIKVVNINKKLVDINSDSKQNSFNEEVPKLFEKFSNTTFPGASESGASGFSNEILDKSLKLSNSITNEALDNIKLWFKNHSEIDEKIKSIEKNLRDYRTDYKNVTTLLQYQNDLLSLQNICNSTFEDVLKELIKLTFDESSGINDADRFLLSKTTSYIEIRTILNRHISKMINASKTNREKVINSILPSELDKINLAITKQNEILNTIIKDLNKKEVDELIKEIEKVQEANNLKSRLNDIIYRIESFDIKKIHEDFSAFEKDGKKELLSAYDYFNVSNYTYYLNPVSITEDLTVLTIDISPKEDITCPAIARSYELNIKAKSGIKIDFSSGFFVNFGGNDFLDQTYKYEPIPDDAAKTRIIRNSTKNSVEPSIGALMHVYPRTGNDIQLAGAFGLSVNNLEKVNYHLGGSLILGNAKRIVLSGGITLGKAELIDDKYELEEILDVEDAPEVIPTSSFNRLGYFISLTYNLSSK